MWFQIQKIIFFEFTFEKAKSITKVICGHLLLFLLKTKETKET